MNTDILNKKNYFKAMEVIGALTPVFKQLDEVLPVVSAITQADSRFSNLEACLSAASGALNELSLTLQSVVADDKSQAEERGMRELVQLCCNRLYKIPEQYSIKRRMFNGDKINHASALNDLTIKGYTAAQIERIMEVSPKPDETAHHAELVALDAEQAALEAFVADFPRYNQDLLIGTQFENWQPEKVVDFDAAAGALAG